jgi:branched-chain amino acid transport system ATP-binding protein
MSSAVAVEPVTNQTPALEVAGVRAGYGEGLVLHDVSLTVQASTVTALLGPNGAGKTTLLRTVSGFLKPSSGRIRFFGTDVTTSPAYKRFDTGMCLVPEGRGVFRSMTVRDNLRVRAPRGEEDACVQRAVEAFPVLGRRIQQIAGTLSGGEQQMLAVSSAYFRNPRLLLVDEVSLGLAPLIVDEIFGFLEGIASRGTALLLVDQYAYRALSFASQAYVLRRGEIVFGGPSSELLGTDLFEQYLGTGADEPEPS